MRYVDRAYKQQYSFALGSESISYELFLKKHLLELHPNFYGLASKQKIKTKDGVMYAVQLSTIIEDPNLESIAECLINSQYIFLWRNRCWAMAVDKDNNPICRYTTGNDLNGLPTWTGAFLNNYQNKSLILYPIGTDPV